MNYVLMFVIIYLGTFIRNFLFKIFSRNISIKYLFISSFIQVAILGPTLLFIKSFNFSNYIAYVILGIGLIVTLIADSKIEKRFEQA